MLLFDQNLSRKLVNRLADLAPDSSHVALLGLDQADDQAVWLVARARGYTAIVTKDTDFNELPTLLGTPPKALRLALGNCTTDQVEQTLRAHWPAITTFLADPTVGLLQIASLPEKPA